jgi:DNA-binding MarR family transcriptional regulator
VDCDNEDGGSLVVELADLVSGIYRFVSGGLGNGDTDYSVTVEQLRLLRMLVDEQDVTMSAIARSAMVSNAAATGIVSRLAQRGLVERHSDATNGRVVLVRVSPKGVAVLEEAKRRADVRLRLLTRHLDAPERSALATSVAALSRALEAERVTATRGRTHLCRQRDGS